MDLALALWVASMSESSLVSKMYRDHITIVGRVCQTDRDVLHLLCYD